MMILQLGRVGGGKRAFDPDHYLNYLANSQGLQQQGQVPKTVRGQPEGSLQAGKVVKGREQLGQEGGNTERGVPQPPELVFRPGFRLPLRLQHCRVDTHIELRCSLIWLSLSPGARRSQRCSWSEGHMEGRRSASLWR